MQHIFLVLVIGPQMLYNDSEGVIPMAKSSNQKLKLLYLVKYLMQHSDEEHPVSTADIIAELAMNGISAERKSIYDDIEVMFTVEVPVF